jgi:hypothetical protein
MNPHHELEKLTAACLEGKWPARLDEKKAALARLAAVKEGCAQARRDLQNQPAATACHKLIGDLEQRGVKTGMNPLQTIEPWSKEEAAIAIWQMENQATITAAAALTDTPQIKATTSWGNRKIAVAILHGGYEQAFYHSQSKQTLLPFDGVGTRIHNGKPKDRIDNHAYQTQRPPHQKPPIRDSNLMRIALLISGKIQDIPETPCNTGREINNLISKDPSHPAQENNREREKITAILQKGPPTDPLWEQLEKAQPPPPIGRAMRQRAKNLLSIGSKMMALAENRLSARQIAKNVTHEDAIPHLLALEEEKQKIIHSIKVCVKSPAQIN